jgi:hypothetical protein
MDIETVKPTEAQKKARRSRNIAIALELGSAVLVRPL